MPDRINLAFKGTTISSGSGRGIVVGTGMKTELGKISALVESAEEEQTPLEKRLDALANKLIWVTLAVTLLTAIAGFLSGKELFLMIETAIALAVAAIPEGLPIVATIALARGMWRMARRNALINKLSAVETLGATTVICTDKTGTLTENRMSVAGVELMRGDGALESRDLDDTDRDAPAEALTLGVLCNNAALNPDSDEPLGDPMEVAILEAGARYGIRRPELLASFKELREEAFSSETSMMATFHAQNEGEEEHEKGVLVAVKGAPEAVLEACTHYTGPEGSRPLGDDLRRRLLERNEELAGQGLRLLGLARKELASAEGEPYTELEFVGFLSLLDPPRKEVPEAIAACRSAGIKVVMVTGDQAPTAVNIARQVGLFDGDEDRVFPGTVLREIDEADEARRAEVLAGRVFSRVSPEQKLRLIELHQQDGSVVAMTGDGVNDAPALKKADIGVAMGRRGTEVARQASDMILRDDAFSTITAAVEQGRVIFGNIRKFVVYLLSCNISEVMTVGIASVAALTLPILPLQILFLNLVTDIFPAFALGVGKGPGDVMEQRAREKREPLLTRRHWLWMIGFSTLMSSAVLSSMAIATGFLGLAGSEAVTISFLTLAMAQLWHVFNMHSAREVGFNTEISRNPYVWGALILCLLLLAAALLIPGLAAVLELSMPTPTGWAVVLGMSLLPTLIGQIALVLGGRYGFAPEL